jgi:tetratricopeptide (TPR) repeat protein
MPLAEEFRRLGRHREAVAVLESALRSQPNHTAAQVALGRCLLECERPDQATDVLQDVLRRDPAQLVANRLLIDALIQRGDAAGSRRQLTAYEGLNRRDPAIAELRAKIERLAAGDAAQGLFQRVAEEPSTPDLTELLPVVPPGGPPALAPGPAAGVSPEPAGPAIEPFPQLLGPPALAVILRALIDGWRQLWGTAAQPAAAAGLAAPLPAAPPAGLPSPRASEPFAGLDEAPPPLLLGELLAAPIRDQESAVEAGPTPASREVSATLGELYLRQGHADEAARIFQQVLERTPGDETAADGLRAALGDAGPGAVSAPARTSRGLRIARLRRYLEQIRRGRMLVVR